MTLCIIHLVSRFVYKTVTQQPLVVAAKAWLLATELLKKKPYPFYIILSSKQMHPSIINTLETYTTKSRGTILLKKKSGTGFYCRVIIQGLRYAWKCYQMNTRWGYNTGAQARNEYHLIGGRKSVGFKTWDQVDKLDICRVQYPQ